MSRRLPLRSRVALAASRAASELSARLGRGHGTVIGGAIATRIDPSVLRRLGAGRTTVFISATNGKSTTAALLAAAVRATLGPTVHNDGGSNMESGLIVALDADHDAPYAILEVDELYLGPLSRALRPQVMTLMNIARDYLERGVRYKRLLRHWRDTIGRMDWPCTIIANADDPFVVWALRGPRGPKPPDIVWVAGGHRWAGDGMVCRDDLVAVRTDPTSNPPGDWWCERCGQRRPEPAWTLVDGVVHGPAVPGLAGAAASGAAEPVAVPLDIGMPGDVNEVNGLFALVTAVVLGAPPAPAAAAFRQVAEVDGRYGRRVIEGRAVRLLLSKNPASWQETVDVAAASDEPLVFDITARGDFNARDTSFVWEAPIERLAGRPVIATGVRAHDIALRLEVAGLEVRAIPDPLDAIRACPPGPVTIATNYPAFLELRDVLAERGTAAARPAGSAR
ncbi:MAG TPA: MurT ligase domain-containing protein [Candidatus Limnocylindrales bacterium]|nr:MurT ligase domain-containing protein [Candidatus Limnocylindrales bacterium]